MHNKGSALIKIQYTSPIKNNINPISMSQNYQVYIQGQRNHENDNSSTNYKLETCYEQNNEKYIKYPSNGARDELDYPPIKMIVHI
jgi:hypothetical protein